MGSIYRFHDVRIDPQSFRLFKAGAAVAIEPKALNLLIFLVENNGRLVERRELTSAIWGDAFVTDHVLNRAIGQVRKVLADDPKEPRYIETVPTRGYRFIAEVEIHSSEASVQQSIPVSAPEKQAESPDREASQPAAQDASPQGVLSAATQSPPAQRNQLHRPALLLSAALLLTGLLITVAAIPGLRRRLPFFGKANIRSLAVLPIENLSGDPSQQYLADGMTAELISDLGRIGALRVISQTTAMQYKGAHKPLEQIAQELQVDAVVEGSVQRSGDRLRIVAQMVQTGPEKQLWSQSYDGDLRDVLGFENQVATSVAGQIRIQLTPREQSILADRRQVNPRAYEALLKGQYFFEENNENSAGTSLRYFQQAVAIDPKFARAYVGIARAYNFVGDSSPGEAAAAADTALAKAIELEPNLAEAYAERAWTRLFFHWDFPGTEKDFRQALELDPGLGDAHNGLGDYYAVMGNFDKAIAEMQIARDQNPLSKFVITDFCHTLMIAHRFDQAVAQCQSALELDPNYSWALNSLADLYLLKHMPREARQIMVKLGVTDLKELAASDELGGLQGAHGAFDAWLKGQKDPPDAYDLASTYACLGRKDEAFTQLAKAYALRIRVHDMAFVPTDPHFDSLRSDPRFDAFLHHAGLPPQPESFRTLGNRATGK